MKRVLMYAAVGALLAVFVMASPASAQSAVRETSCTAVNGSNRMTYDCGFNVKNYTLGSPVTFSVNWSCTGTCGSVTSFGLRDSGFTPANVSGHMMGARRTSNGIDLIFAFDSLQKTGNGYAGNAHFKMTVQMDDGTGTMSDVPCKMDVHLDQ
jgi:hypothetical protein